MRNLRLNLIYLSFFVQYIYVDSSDELIFSIHPTVLEKKIFKHGTRLGYRYPALDPPKGGSAQSEPTLERTLGTLFLSSFVEIQSVVSEKSNVIKDRRWTVSDTKTFLEPLAHIR